MRPFVSVDTVAGLCNWPVGVRVYGILRIAYLFIYLFMMKSYTGYKEMTEKLYHVD